MDSNLYVEGFPDEMESIRKGRESLMRFPAASGYMLFPVSPFGPLIAIGPRTGGAVIISPPQEAQESDESYQDRIATAREISSMLKRLDIPVDTPDGTYNSIILLGWGAIENNSGDERSITDESVFSAIMGASQSNGAKWLSAGAYTPLSPIAPEVALDSIGVQKSDSQETSPADQNPSIASIGSFRHIPEMDSADIAQLSDDFDAVFRQVAGSRTVMIDDIAVCLEDVCLSWGYLPALLAHTVREWTPIALGTKQGLGVLIISEPEAIMGYCLGGIAEQRNRMMLLAMAEATRRLCRDDVIDLRTPMMSLRKYLVRGGHSSHHLDVLLGIKGARPDGPEFDVELKSNVA